jgi:peptidylprolyl isomerase
VVPDGGTSADASVSPTPHHRATRRHRGGRAGIIAAGIAVVLVGGGLGYYQFRPHSGGGQNWYAVGKGAELAAEQRDSGVPVGPASQLATMCTAYLNAAHPAQRPVAPDRTAVTQWVQGCEAGYHQAHPDRLVNGSTATVTGAFGAPPVVTIPVRPAPSSLFVKTLIRGAGAKVTTADGVIANYVAYDWSGTTHKLLGSSYASGSPSLFVGKLLPGLAKAMIGQQAGSRVLAVIPPADGFGSAGSSKEGIGASDTLVFVVDIDSAFSTAGVPGTQASIAGGALPTVTPPTSGAPHGPVVTIPAGTAPPQALRSQALIKGAGPVVRRGQNIAVQYTGVLWRTGKVFSSSWSGSAPLTTAIGEGQVIKGWDTGLVGQTVGSRVLLVIPPADAYGSAGEPKVGINGSDTLVFVVDILAAS